MPFNGCRLARSAFVFSVAMGNTAGMKKKRSARQKSRDAIYKAADKAWWGTVAELAHAHLELYPTEIGARVHMARALTRLSRFEEAHSALDQAFEDASKDWHEHIFSARGKLEQRRGDFAQAEHWYARAIEVAPQGAYNYIFLGILVFQRGEMKRAEEIYRNAIATVVPTEGDEFDEIYANLGGILVAQERYDEAIKCFERALELDPNYEFAKIRLKDVRKLRKLRQSP